MSVYKFSLYETFRILKEEGSSNLHCKEPNCFTKYQVEQFYNLECFDKKVFNKYYPDDPEYRGYVISLTLSCIGSASKISPFPIEGSNKNITKETVKTINQAIKELSKAIKTIDKLPSGFDYANYIDPVTNETKQVYRDGLKGYLNDLQLWEDDLKGHSKNELLLNRLFVAFETGYDIPEYDNITETPLMNEIISIFTGIDILDVPKTLQRYKDKLTQK